MMLKNLISLMLVFALVSIAPLASIAQTTQTKQEKKAAQVKEKIQKFGTGEKAKVKIKTYAGTTYQGYVSSSTSEDFVVVDKAGASHTIRYADVDKIGGKNLSTGAKIAIGIGIGVGATILAIFLIIASLDE